MNKKVTVKRPDGLTMYCILSGEQDLNDQLNVWYYGSANPPHGMCVNFDGVTLNIVDYYHADIVESFDVISIEDTNDDVLLKWAEA